MIFDVLVVLAISAGIVAVFPLLIAIVFVLNTERDEE